MARKIRALRPTRTEGVQKATNPLTLADIRVTHTIGNQVTKISGADLARLIEATRHLHDRTEESDFINPAAVAFELTGLAEVLCALSESEEYGLERALPYAADQLRRIAKRVMAVGSQSGNQLPDWYKVEVSKK